MATSYSGCDLDEVMIGLAKCDAHRLRAGQARNQRRGAKVVHDFSRRGIYRSGRVAFLCDTTLHLFSKVRPTKVADYFRRPLLMFILFGRANN